MTSLSDQTSSNANRVLDSDTGKHSIFTRLPYLIPLIAFPLFYASRASYLITVIQLRSTSSPPSYTSIDDAWARWMRA
ncbi:hypothetical protein BDZ94DRAFT_1247492 [Collybia nuda]|uniref:Uncharacterized protein n=1 Tax=Collybia nuda TaxID=64659 RepID=A0A9P6CQ27_9AGAR|nr:hypothetical protein BDZ94DRAFT_1247492 [Collybia nuda]